MEHAEVARIVKRVLEDELGVPGQKIVPQADLREDLELDSLDRVEFVTAMEGEMSLRIEESALAGLRTVQDVVDAVVSVAGTSRPSSAT